MFLKRFASLVQSAEARGLVPDMEEYLPPRPGEVVIGTVTDPALLALLRVYDENFAEFTETWPVPPTSTSEMKAAFTAGANRETLKGIVLAELRAEFQMGPGDECVLRQGYGGPLVLLPAPPDVVDGLTNAAKAAVQTVRESREEEAIVDFLSEMLTMPPPDVPCGDPDCPVHGHGVSRHTPRGSRVN
jgi:hypothetical protein